MISNNHEKGLFSLLEILKDTAESLWVTYVRKSRHWWEYRRISAFGSGMARDIHMRSNFSQVHTSRLKAHIAG